MTEKVSDWGLNILTALIALGAFLLIIAGVGLSFGLFIGSILWISNEADLPLQLAKIEQLRSDVSQVSISDSEDVVGQVTEWNQIIRSRQAANDTWYYGWTIPDEWDNVELIPIPERK